MKEYFYNISGAPIEEISSKVRPIGGSQFLGFGENNKYPSELFNLFKSVPTLRTLVEGSALVSSSLFSGDLELDWNKLFFYLYLYGQCPILVRQSRDLRSMFLTPIDPRFVRSNEDGSMFAYSESDGFRKRVEYPKYTGTESGTSIIMIRLNDFEHPYALPIWSSALKEVSILGKVSAYHNSSLDNGFSGSYLISFNNGTPSDEDKAEIERLVQDKFGGANNAGRIMLSFSDSKETEPTVQSLNTEDTSTRYGDLVRSCKEALFTSFRASSQLFGAPDGSETALTATEYAYKMSLFVKFTVEPITKVVFNELKKFGVVREDPMSLVEDVKTAEE